MANHTHNSVASKGGRGGVGAKEARGSELGTWNLGPGNEKGQVKERQRKRPRKETKNQYCTQKHGHFCPLATFLIVVCVGVVSVFLLVVVFDIRLGISFFLFVFKLLFCCLFIKLVLEFWLLFMVFSPQML